MRSLRVAVVAAVLSAVIAGSPAAHADDASTPFPLRPGDSGPYVEVVQKRLSWLGYDIADTERSAAQFGPTTSKALRAFERKFADQPTDAVTPAVWDRLRTIAGPVGALPKACRTETSICIDMRQRLVRFVEDGAVVMTTDARFGLPGQETARGTFRVQSRSRDHWSTLFDTAMPFALFFHGGQAVHYSAYFRRDGYAGASHGCVNLRDRAKAEWLFDHAPIGTRVHVS